MDPANSLDAWLLIALVLAPACAAVALLVLSVGTSAFDGRGLPASVWRVSAVVVALGSFLAAGFTALDRFDPERLGLQAIERIPWSPVFGLEVVVGLDGITLFFLLSTTGLVLVQLLSSWTERDESERTRLFATLWLGSTLTGAILAANLLVFIGFWTLSIVPALVWLGRFGGPGRGSAAARIWTMEAISLAGLLVAAFFLHEASLTQLGFPTLSVVGGAGAAGDLRSLLDVRIELPEQRIVGLALAFALATRLPIVPFHVWLPAAQAAAPTGLGVLLVTGFVQTAAVGAIRFALPLLPDAAAEAGPWLAVLGIVALVYTSLIALVQKELKRLVAYASAGNAGFALFGLSTLNVQGITGAVVQLLAHGLATAGLLTLIGFLARRRGTTEVAAFGGLAKPMPVCAFFFGVMVLSLMGLPLLGGFVGDLFVLLGSLETRRTLSFVALVAMVVAASYLLWVQRRLFLGPVDEPANRGLIDLDRRERAVLLAITLPIVAIGVYPNPVLRRVEPAVLELLYQMERREVKVAPPAGAESGEEELVLRRRPGRVARRSVRAGGAR